MIDADRRFILLDRDADVDGPLAARQYIVDQLGLFSDQRDRGGLAGGDVCRKLVEGSDDPKAEDQSSGEHRE